MLSSLTPVMLWSTSVSWKGAFRHLVPWCLCLVPQFLWLLPRGRPLMAWSGGWGGAGIPGPQRTVAIQKMVLGRLPSLGHCTDSSLGHTLKFYSEGGLFACPGASASRTGFRLGTYLVAMQGMQAVNAPLVLSLYLAPACQIHLEKNLYICLKTFFFFYNCHP